MFLKKPVLFIQTKKIKLCSLKEPWGSTLRGQISCLMGEIKTLLPPERGKIKKIRLIGMKITRSRSTDSPERKPEKGGQKIKSWLF